MPRNPNEVIEMRVTADALRLLLQHTQRAASASESEYARSVADNVHPRTRAIFATSARLSRGVARDLAAVFEGETVTVGETMTAERALGLDIAAKG